MKLEIDLNNKPQLKQLQGELSRYLKIVEFALKETHSEEVQNGHVDLPLNGKPIDKNEGVSTVLAFIESMPAKTFNSSSLYSFYKGKISRGVVKAGITEAIEKRKIEEVQKGVGRRPSKYKKL